jgi:hypothetical protein
MKLNYNVFLLRGLKNTVLGLTMMMALSAPQAMASTTTSVSFLSAGQPTYSLDDTGAMVFTTLSMDRNVQAYGSATQDARGVWNVTSSANGGLAVFNGVGATFTVPRSASFDFDSVKMAGFSSHYKNAVPLTYNLWVYHPGIVMPDIIPFTIASRTAVTYSFKSFSQAKSASKVFVEYPLSSFIGKTYFIGATITTP